MKKSEKVELVILAIVMVLLVGLLVLIGDKADGKCNAGIDYSTYNHPVQLVKECEV